MHDTSRGDHLFVIESMCQVWDRLGVGCCGWQAEGASCLLLALCVRYETSRGYRLLLTLCVRYETSRGYRLLLTLCVRYETRRGISCYWLCVCQVWNKQRVSVVIDCVCQVWNKQRVSVVIDCVCVRYETSRGYQLLLTVCVRYETSRGYLLLLTVCVRYETSRGYLLLLTVCVSGMKQAEGIDLSTLWHGPCSFLMTMTLYTWPTATPTHTQTYRSVNALVSAAAVDSLIIWKHGLHPSFFAKCSELFTGCVMKILDKGICMCTEERYFGLFKRKAWITWNHKIK